MSISVGPTLAQLGFLLSCWNDITERFRPQRKQEVEVAQKCERHGWVKKVRGSKRYEITRRGRLLLLAAGKLSAGEVEADEFVRERYELIEEAEEHGSDLFPITCERGDRLLRLGRYARHDGSGVLPGAEGAGEAPDLDDE